MSAVDPLEAFQLVRPRLFGIAYRMLGSVGEAEDVVQDAWLRWQSADHAAVKEPGAFLATTVTRLAMNELDSARARRERYVGPWLPEPILTTADDPLLGAERREAMSLAVLMLMERLTPTERAAYVLREAFVYSHREIAEVLDTSEANARQLTSRARAHIQQERGEPADPGEVQRLLQVLIAAALEGDLDGLESALAADAAAYSDGGGLVTAARKPSFGRARVAVFLRGIVEKFGAGATSVPVLVNGDPGFAALRDGVVTTIGTLDATADGARHLLFVVNPEKLTRIHL